MANIFVNRKPVGALVREEPQNRFIYEKGVAPGEAVSLLMPVNGEPYLAERTGALHPVFDMSLPEGALRAAVSNLFAKALPVFDDFALFQIVGRSLIGRIRCGETASQLDEVPTQDLKDLLQSRGTGELFADLLNRYAQYSGVAGIQPKVLVRDSGSLRTESHSPITSDHRITAHGTTHIVKSFDPTQFPGLAANEFLCLQAARAAGLEVAKTEIAADGRILVVERFDLKPDGTYRAFEDGCALDGRLSQEKYQGSYEQLAKTLTSVVRTSKGTASELAKFFRAVVFSVAIRNGDAHRKNFGVTYDDATGDVTLAPTFDVITTTPYLPGDSLALTLDGTKRWPEARRLIRFGVRSCQIAPSIARQIVAEVSDAVAAAIGSLERVPELDSQASETGTRMRAAWQDGLKSLRS